jgi:hypothetical protein
MRSLKIEIANICGQITSEDEKLIHRINSSYKDFASTRQADFVFGVDSDSQIDSDQNHSNILNDLEQNVFLLPRNGGYSFVSENRQVSIGFIDIGKSEVQLYRLPGQEVGLYFDLLFMHAVRLFLAYKQGFFLHSCGLIKDDLAFLFVGPDGSGKTTISKLISEGFIASDDSLIVRKSNGFFTLYATPWGSRESINASAPISKIFFLRKANALKIKKMTPAEAAKEFLANTFFNTLDHQICQRTLETIARLTKEISCHELYFPRDEAKLDRIFNF